jgi:hypothetical protein
MANATSEKKQNIECLRDAGQASDFRFRQRQHRLPDGNFASRQASGGCKR